jgi:hypothetical protein
VAGGRRKGRLKELMRTTLARLIDLLQSASSSSFSLRRVAR